MPCPQELTGLQVHNQRKSGAGKKTFFSFLSRCHASIISSSSRLGRRDSLSLDGQAGSINFHFFMCAENMSQLTKLTGQDVGLMSPVFYCLGACLVLLMHGFVAKRAWFCG